MEQEHKNRPSPFLVIGTLLLASMTIGLMAAELYGQQNPQQGHGAPSGVCVGPYVDTDTGNFYVCKVGQYLLSGGGSAGNSVFLSPNCVASPCVSVPAPGGCVNNISITNNSAVVTFLGTFPSGIQPGMVAWVQLHHGNASIPCGTIEAPPGSGTPLTPIGDTNYIGLARTAGGTQVTVSSVNAPGLTVTLSQNANATTSGTNVWFHWGPNIYAQMQTACNTAATITGFVRLPRGVYVLDNTGNGSTRACANAAGITGEGQEQSVLLTPPWYNHEADLGTVFLLTSNNATYLADFTLDGTWTALNVTIGRGTPINIGGCGKVERMSIRGYFFGAGDTSEMLYPNLGAGNAPCYVIDSMLINQNRGIALSSGKLILINDYIYAGSAVVFTATTLSNELEIHGGTYSSNMEGPDVGFFVLPCTGCGSVSGDSVRIDNASLCWNGGNYGTVTGGLFNIGASETTGLIRLNNVSVNSGNSCAAPSNLNLTTLSVPTGWIAKVSASDLVSAGTGNTINNAGTVYQDLMTLQNTSGGSGYTGAGTNHHTETGTCTFAAATTCVVTFTQGFGVTPNIFIPPNIPATATTLTISAQSATQFTITASASNSATVGWSAML